MDNICALITPQGVSAIATVRVSGADCFELLKEFFKDSASIVNAPRVAHFKKLYVDNKHLDDVVITAFESPKSFTGENLFEVSLHGSPYLVGSFLKALFKKGVRQADPGEFSRRAYLNGKMDLAQVEAINDLIHSQSELQAKVAREQLSGKLSGAISDFGDPLRDVLAEIEAYIDFPDEDIDPKTSNGWLEDLTSLKIEILKAIESFKFGKLHRDGAKVALVGEPNVGKSTLLNLLLGEERAIVTNIPGTTRDTIEEVVSFDGLLVRLCDTAGIEQDDRTVDEVERLGIERSWRAIDNADLVLLLVDLSKKDNLRLKPLLEKRVGKKLFIVGNKSDLDSSSLIDFKISAKNGLGLSELRSKIKEFLIPKDNSNTSLMITTERHLNCLELSNQFIDQSIEAIKIKQPPELVAFEVRAALTALNDIIGVTTSDEILGRVFSKFCIGK